MTDSAALIIPAIVRRRAEAFGAEGLAWLSGAEALVTGMAADWGVRLGQMLPGGSASLVFEVRTEKGSPAVLKVGVPGSEAGRQEAQVLQAAAGRGYARLFRHDRERRALLLEAWGSRSTGSAYRSMSRLERSVAPYAGRGARRRMGSAS